MDPLNIIKIIGPLITGIIALIAGIIELRLNPKNWLNRWFFSFFISSSIGFLVYGFYHLVIISETFTSIDAVIAQIFFNFIPISLVMTVFVLEKFPKVAMSFKYLGTMLAIFILMSFGYFIFPPKPDPDKFEDHIINTITPLPWYIFVNIIRMVLFGYALFKYSMITKKTEDEAKKRIRWFFVGTLVAFVGLFSNLIGEAFDNLVIQVLSLILINIGAIIIVKGFFI